MPRPITRPVTRRRPRVFCARTVLDSVYTDVSPCNTKGKDTTTDVGDHVYTPETQGRTELVLTGDAASGYAATFAINLPMTNV